MDETPIKAGRKQKGKMRQAYFWPVYGEQDEIVFHYSDTRAARVVNELLGGFQGTLLTDGYDAYKRYAQKNSHVTHAECWAHTRRYFERAEAAEPQAAQQALALIGALYQHEQHIRDKNREGDAKLKYRTEHSEPIVKQFWAWCEEQCQRHDLECRGAADWRSTRPESHRPYSGHCEVSSLHPPDCESDRVGWPDQCGQPC